MSVCTTTGDLFWRCPTGKCAFVAFCQHPRNLTALDVGQILPMGSSGMDRYTTLTYVMRWFGHSLGRTFWVNLHARPQDAPYPPGSKPMQLGDRYDSFISYRGASGRVLLQLTLCGYHNTFPAFCFLYVVCPIIVGFINFIPEPCTWSESTLNTWSWLMYGNNVCQLSIVFRSWFIFRAYAAPLSIITILLWNPVFSFLQKRRYFFDKYCIHQSDVGVRLPNGIRRLPLFCQKSNELHCLFDLEYSTRLWCVFEIALFLRMHKNPRIVFTSISQRSVEVIVIVLVMIGCVAANVTSSLLNSTVGQTEGVSEPGQGNSTGSSALATLNMNNSDSLVRAYQIASIVVWAINFLAVAAVFHFGSLHFRTMANLRDSLMCYDVVNAKLGVEADRPALLG